MSEGRGTETGKGSIEANSKAKRSPKPSAAQRRYLEKGADQPGGKLPLFDDRGREFKRRTIEACIENGWAEPWFSNPLKPNWLVCKLTEAGRRALED